MTRLRTLRGRLTALALLVALLAIAALTVAFNVVLEASLASDANSRLRSRAAAAATTVAVDRGRLRIREGGGDRAVDQDIWVYQGTRALERPATGRDLQRAADALAGRSSVFQDVPTRDFRLYAHPVEVGARQLGTVVAGQSLAAYERTTDLALLSSLALGALLLAAMGALSSVLVGRALGPVRDITRSAADWSEHDPGRRFGRRPRPDELGELASTFDRLLDRLAASLRHEQRLSAELSHELRTPLARIVAETELLQRREREPEDRRDALASIARSADQMSRILETLMAAARADAGLGQGRADVAAALAAVAREWAPLLAERGLELAVDGPGAPLEVGVDAEVIERVLAPLLDNARRMARRNVVLGARSAGERVTLTVGDDGPGPGPGAAARLFEPGVSGADNEHGGAGLGLPLARRLARAVGGDVVLEDGGAGATFCVHLPA